MVSEKSRIQHLRQPDDFSLFSDSDWHCSTSLDLFGYAVQSSCKLLQDVLVLLGRFRMMHGLLKGGYPDTGKTLWHVSSCRPL